MDLKNQRSILNSTLSINTKPGLACISNPKMVVIWSIIDEGSKTDARSARPYATKTRESKCTLATFVCSWDTSVMQLNCYRAASAHKPHASGRITLACLRSAHTSANLHMPMRSTGVANLVCLLRLTGTRL